MAGWGLVFNLGIWQPYKVGFRLRTTQPYATQGQKKNMVLQKIKISDKEFIEQYMTFNLAHRCIICEACLKSFDLGNWAVKKSIGIEVIFQYVGMLEDTAMIYYALKEKSKHKSFFKSLSKIFIKEKHNEEYTSKIIFKELEELEKISFEDFLKNLNLPLPKEAVKFAEVSLINELGGQEKAQEQYKKETVDILKNIQKMIGNRFQDKKGGQLELVKIYNKIKHGSIFVDDKTNEVSVYFPTKIENIDRQGKEVGMEAYNLICNKKEELGKLVNQMKILSDNSKNLLRFFYLYNYS